MFCLKCGTELPDGSVFCSSCGIRLGADPPGQDAGQQVSHSGWEGESWTPPPPPPPQTYSEYDSQDYESNPYIRRERDSYGHKIPIEYPPQFDRNGWCWPGFFFPVYWCCIKGIYNQAWKYILVGLIPFVGGLVASIWCGVVGYKEYSDFISQNSPQQIEKSKKTGIGCLIAIIALGVLGLILYIILLIFVFTLGDPASSYYY